MRSTGTVSLESGSLENQTIFDEDSWYGYDSMMDTSDYSSDSVEDSDSDSYSSDDENVTPF